jgi:atypical dual specificity phosphatase
MGNAYSISYTCYIRLLSLCDYYLEINNQNLNEVYPRIYVGNLSTSLNKKLLKEKGITHVIIALTGLSPPYPDDFKYLTLSAIDVKTFNLSQHFENSSNFINQALQNTENKVYVHCVCGVSRSVSIVCAYLIKKYGITPLEAITKIQTQRRCANPNEGFINQLEEYLNNNKFEKNKLPDFYPDETDSTINHVTIYPEH